MPSTGKALTGSRSPLPAIIIAVTRCDEVGRARPAPPAAARGSLVDRAGHRHLVQVRQRVVDGGEVLPHDLGAALAVGLLDRVLDAAIASSRGSTPESAKKQVCMIVLMRAAHARFARDHVSASIT